MNKEYLTYGLTVVISLVLLAVVFFGSGCAFCTAEETRCHGNVAQICDGRNWRDMRNCDEVQFESGNRGRCQQTPIDGEMTHTCLEYQDD